MQFDSEPLQLLANALRRDDSPDASLNEIQSLAVEDVEVLSLLAVLFRRELWCQALLQGVDVATLGRWRQLAALWVETDEVESFVDGALDEANLSVLQSLIRAQVVWSHPSFEEMLNQKGAASDAAALLIAQHEPDLIDSWIGGDEPDDIESVLAVLRAASFAEGGISLELLFLLREALEQEDAHKAITQLDAIIALVDLNTFSRRVMLGDAETAWMRQPQEVADILSVYGATSWLETLAILETAQAMTAFEFAALLAIGTTGSFLLIEGEEEKKETLEALDAVQQRKKSWDAQALALELSVPLALGDDDLAPLMVEAALHERLFASGIHSPGISGLPLSSSDIDAIHLDGARALLADVAQTDKPDDETVVRAVRTMTDAHRFLNHEDEHLQAFFDDQVWETLMDHRHSAINLAAKQVGYAHQAKTSTSHNTPKRNVRFFLSNLLLLEHQRQEDRQLLTSMAQETSVVSLLSMMMPGTVWDADQQALELLGELLLVCDVTRCDVVRDTIDTLMTRAS